MKRIYLNGSPVTGRIDGLSDLEYKTSLSDTNLAQELEVTTDLTFYDAGWQVIKSILIDPPGRMQNSISVRIWDDCCDSFLPKDFKITAEDIRFCDGDCFVNARLRVDDPDAEILRQLKNKKINDEAYFIDPNQIPKFNYCVENRANGITHMLIALGLFVVVLFNVVLAPIVILVTALSVIIFSICAFILAISGLLNLIINAVNLIVSFVNFVITAYNSIPLLPNLPTINLNVNNINLVPPVCQPFLQNPIILSQELRDLKQLIFDFIVTCRKKHPAPLVRYYLQIIGSAVGAQVQSYAFQNPNSPRYDTCLLNAPENEGEANPPTIIVENIPVWSMAEMLDKLAIAINGKWFVNNGVIYLERKDYLESQAVYFDAINESQDIIKHACYDHSPEQPYASTMIRFQEDSREEVGNDILRQYRIDVDYQQFANNGALEGRMDVEIPFAPVRVRNDEMRPAIKYDALTFWRNLIFPDVILNGYLSQTMGYMMLEKGTTSIPKLIVWDRNSGLNDAKVFNYGQGDYNRPWKLSWLQGSLRRYGPDYFNFQPQPNGSLYDEFAIDDPRVNPYKEYRFTIRVRFDCRRLRNAIPRRRVILPGNKNGRIESIVINLNSKSPYIEISGTV
jgi:hypothetical protein